jgi:UvrD-like helicase C-terminal domain/Nuclease-related domain/AAA domain
VAICIPAPEIVTTASAAEMRLFSALSDQLDDNYLVLHSVAWISKPGGQGPRDGESDLLICHPQHGVLVIEVKGGRIDLDYGKLRWTSTDRNGAVHLIKNPFEQAKRGKYGILEKLKENPAWQRLRIGRFTLGHAVFLPDISDSARLKGPDAPSEIMGDRNDIETLCAWTIRTFSYWREENSRDRRADAIGSPGVETIRHIFARVATTRPLLSARLQDEEHERIELTRRQATVLDFLSRQRRVMIAGGAGTGKTLIARQKAERLAEEGLRTLLVCYNRGLADHLREQCNDIKNLDVASFHQVCHRWIARAQAELGRDLMAECRRDYPGRDTYDHHQPIALAMAVDALGPAYDGIVVDEAQDFGDEFWMPIEMLLTRPDEALLYVFLDENQDIYGRSAAIPIKGEPIVLDRNCRNTGSIHAAAYRYYRGATVEASSIPGIEPVLITAIGVDKQARAISALITRLVAEEKVAPHDIAVLLCDTSNRDIRERALATNPIPVSAKFGRLEAYGPGSITVDSVARFKGLERAVVILWALDDCSPAHDRETLYVGMSRAKSLLYLCGTQEACKLTMAAGKADAAS